LNGPNEVKSHIWFKSYDWQGLLDKKVEAPYKPAANTDNFDKAQANKADNDDPEQMKEHHLMLQRPSIQALFDGYHYYPMGRGQEIQIPPGFAKDNPEIMK